MICVVELSHAATGKRKKQIDAQAFMIEFPVLIERWTHPVPCRTWQLSTSSPMVLRRVFVGEQAGAGIS